MKMTLKSIVLTGLLTTGVAGATLLPCVRPATAQEQSFYELQAPAGIPIQAVNTVNENLYLDSDRIYDYHLKVRRSTYFGDMYIPAGAIIQGRYEPADGGLRYVAQSVSFDDNTYPLNAASDVLEGTRTTTNKPNGRTIAKDTGIGAAGAAALEGIFGHHLSLKGIFGGAAAGAVAGAVTSHSSHQVVVIGPEMPITLYSR